MKPFFKRKPSGKDFAIISQNLEHVMFQELGKLCEFSQFETRENPAGRTKFNNFISGGIMRIISWNVNGIRSIYKKGFLNWLQRDGNDILCLQEIKACVGDVPVELKETEGYFSYWNSSERKGYGGVAILSKQKPVEVRYGFGTKKFDTEGRILILRFPQFTLLNLYFPHGRRDKSKLPLKLEMYSSFFAQLEKLGKNIVLCGDFNIAHEEIDLARPKDNKNNTMFTLEERKQIDGIINLGFIDTFRHLHQEAGKYTWWPYLKNARKRNIGWRIDYIFVSNDLAKNVKEAFILSDVTGSDHCPIGIEFESSNVHYKNPNL